MLYAEPGAHWRVIAYGPVICLVFGLVEIPLGMPLHWAALTFFAAVIAAIVWLQVIAGRRHVSVELTGTYLRNGAETLDLARIAEIFPEPETEEIEPWETARSLGELTDVPRRRHPIGLRLTGGDLVRAWARHDEDLRKALERAVQERK